MKRRRDEWVRHRIILPDDDDYDELDEIFDHIEKADKRDKERVIRGDGMRGV